MKLLLYCTKGNKSNRLVKDNHYGKDFYLCGAITENFESLNGKIVAECDFEVEDIELVKSMPITPISDAYVYITKTIKNNTLLNKACLTYPEMEKYLGELNYGGKNGYAIHIKNLHIFDEPRELSDYYKYIGKPITNAPQNMMKAFSIKEYSRSYVENGYVYEVRGDDITDYVLISIRPEWLCKILNGEKTIEVRKKVLREMVK